MTRLNSYAAPLLALLGGLVATGVAGGTGTEIPRSAAAVARERAPQVRTATPIRHLVVIFQENVSFDHYFGTYPNAANPPGEPRFDAAPGTPAVNGLNTELLEQNPNSSNPRRLGPLQDHTCDQDHNYRAEQIAFHRGLMDLFVESAGAHEPGCDPRQVMDYYDGNTVTAMWNYAQHFTLSDRTFGTTFGPSTPGALNLIAGQSHGAYPTELDRKIVHGTMIANPNPWYDDCSRGSIARMSGRNVGNLLNARGVTWGWFQGGFRPTSRRLGYVTCGAAHPNLAGVAQSDYISHHAPFQYYRSTANRHHLAPSSAGAIGHSDRAKHQYDLRDFWRAARAGRMPAVSFLKGRAFENGHAEYSGPLEEQRFLVATINRIQRLPQWRETAIIVAYDDSDGWYDHAMGPIRRHSRGLAHDARIGRELCGRATRLDRVGRCGWGPRMPLLVISPYARVNHVDHKPINTTSILRFIEDNWKLGRIGHGSFDAESPSLTHLFDFRGRRAPRLFLDPYSGRPVDQLSTRSSR